MVYFHIVDYKPNFSLCDFEFLQDPKDKRSKLGVGSFAAVKLAREKKTGKLFALKMVDIDSKKASKTDIKNLITEIQIHKNLDHPNIIKFHGYVHQDNFVYLVLDYAENGNLYTYLHRKKVLSDKEIFRFFYQSCLAVDYLHKNNVIHRDIKPENLLLDKDYNIKVCDFGWSAYEIDQERKTFCGTYEYMAPEIVNKKTYDYRVDIWALGVLLYELIHSKAPYQGRSIQEIKNSLSKGQIAFDMNIQIEAKNLIRQILKENPSNRLLIDQILSDSWITSHIENETTIKQYTKTIENQMSETDKSKAKNITPELRLKSLQIYTKPISQLINMNEREKNQINWNSALKKDNSSHFLRERSVNATPNSATIDSSLSSAMISVPRGSGRGTPKKFLKKKIFDGNLLSPSFHNRLDKIIYNLSTKNSSIIQPSQDITLDLMEENAQKKSEISKFTCEPNMDIFQSFSNLILANVHEGPNNINNLKVNLPYRFEKHPNNRSLLNVSNIEKEHRVLQNESQKSICKTTPQTQREHLEEEPKRRRIFENHQTSISDKAELKRKIAFRTIEDINLKKSGWSFSDKIFAFNKENTTLPHFGKKNF